MKNLPPNAVLGRPVGEAMAANSATNVHALAAVPGILYDPDPRYEKDFQADIVRIAPSFGWEGTYHTFDSRKSEPDFPDLVMRRGDSFVCRVLVFELKVKKNKPTAGQSAWLAAFRAMGIVAECVWPSNWEMILKLLRSS
jgi:hypothetical protein